MNRNHATLALFIFLVAVLLVLTRTAGRRAAASASAPTTTGSLLVTQEGRMTVVPNPGPSANFAVTMNNPRPSTNPPPFATNAAR
jgi:hypothetical protein